MIYRRLLSVTMAVLFAVAVIGAFQPSMAEARGFHRGFHGRSHHGGFHRGHHVHGGRHFRHGGFHHHRFRHHFHGPRHFSGFYGPYFPYGYYPYGYYPYWPGLTFGVGFGL